MKIRINRALLTFILINELRGLAMIAPALLATLKFHHRH